MEIFSYDEMPDYILAVDEESRRIVFVNKAIRNSSVMTASQINEFISKPFEDGFIDLFLRKKSRETEYRFFRKGSSRQYSCKAFRRKRSS